MLVALRAIWNAVGGAAKRVGYLTLSLVCGIGIPLSPLAAEAHFKGEVDEVAWFSAGVVYVAGIGLASKSQQVLLFMVIGAGVLAFLYGCDLTAEVNHNEQPVSAIIAKWGLVLGALTYAIERVGLHLINGSPFP